MPAEIPAGSSTKKPVTPALSSRFRNTRPPLAPRLAGTVSSPPATTVRKETRVGAQSSVPHAVPKPLGDNVTPRSVARVSRAGTDSPATPDRTRRPSTTSSAVTSPAINTFNSRSVANNVDSLQSRTLRRISGSSTVVTKEEDPSKFFYAGDVKPQPVSSKPILQSTKSAIFSAVRNADQISSIRPASLPGTNEEHFSSPDGEKFIRADDLTPNQTPRARPVLPKQPSSTSATSLRTKSPVVSRQNSALSPRMSPQRPATSVSSRPASPIKNFVTSPQLVTSPASPSERRNSIGSNSVISRQSGRGGHKKSASVSTVTRSHNVTSPSLPRLQVSDPVFPPNTASEQHPLFPAMLASPDSISPRSASLNSAKTIATSTTSDTEISDIAKIILAVKESQTDAAKDLTSIPAKPSPLSQAQIDAANARRERKVLDLEISNSSLLAINKTLERELRKQSAEIRRFRRLSRSGRLSLAPTNRSVSAQSMLSALSEQAEEEDNEFDSSDMEDDEEDDISDPDDDNVSDTDSITARARRRAREERRLMLDLSKHQQLLIDSQKLSQSIRKCVNLTEELIKDGKQALSYKVGIGDVKLGGRVLSGDEYDEDANDQGELGRGLLSPSLTRTELQEASMWLGGIQSLDGQNMTQPESGLLESFDKLKLVQTEPG